VTNRYLIRISDAKNINVFQQDLYSRLILLALSKIFYYVTNNCTSVELKDNQRINFNDCMKIVRDNILEKIIYEPIDSNTINEILRIVQIIRKSTYIFESDRHYPRIAIRTIFDTLTEIIKKITNKINNK